MLCWDVCAGIPEGVDAFQGNGALLQQLSTAATALDQAQAQVAAAEMLLASSQAAAAQAQLTIEEATAEAAATEQQLTQKTPAAIARAQGMLPVLDPMVTAAESALPYVTDGLATTLRALVTLVERNSAARDLAPVVKAVCLQHGRCLHVLQRLHAIGAAAAVGLKQVLQGMWQWQQQQQGLPVQQESAYAVLVATNLVQDAQLMQLLLAELQPALAGVKEELGELGQVGPEGVSVAKHHMCNPPERSSRLRNTHAHCASCDRSPTGSSCTGGVGVLIPYSCCHAGTRPVHAPGRAAGQLGWCC
jgi:hypothetical protein